MLVVLKACLDNFGDDYIQTAACVCVSPPHNDGKLLLLSPVVRPF